MSLASAQGKPLEASYVAAKLTLGFDLVVDSVSSASIPVAGPQPSTSSDSSTAYGCAAQYVLPLHPYFALGATFGFFSWRSPSDRTSVPRNSTLDFALLPEGKYAVSDAVELYLAVPLGLSFADFGDSSRSALGPLLGGLLGMRVQLTSWFGFLAELGYLQRMFSQRSEVKVLHSQLPYGEVQTVSRSLGLFAFDLGLVVAL